MSSVGNQNPWASYDNYRDCSQGICSVYCPQFCYLMFPPPPPSDDNSGGHFSPFTIVIIGLLACTVLLVIYYTVVTRYCRRGSAHGTGVEAEQSRDELAQDQWQVAPAGLDEALIKSIAVCKYRKGDGLIEGTECAVCLCEFQENESLRLLPKCRHAFHLPCIDTWLKSQSSCPLCRASVVALAHPSSPPGADSQDSPAFNLSSYEIQRPNDLILVVEDRERNCHEQMVVISEDSIVRNETVEADQDRAEQLRRSVPLGTFSPQRQLLISDILKFEEINEYVQVESDQLWRGSGSSTEFPMEERKSGTNRSRDGELLRSPVAMKKFTPGGRFIFNAHDRGKNSILPI